MVVVTAVGTAVVAVAAVDGRIAGVADAVVDAGQAAVRETRDSTASRDPT